MNLIEEARRILGRRGGTDVSPTDEVRAVGALSDVGAEDEVDDEEIRRYVESHDAQAAVARDGTCFVVDGQMGVRAERGLLELVAAQVGQSRRVAVSPLDYQTWSRERRGPAEAERKAVPAARTRNLSVGFVLGEAIEDGASDVYLDVFNENGANGSRLAFRTFGLKREVRRFGYEEGNKLARAMWTQGGETYDPSWACDVSFGFEHGGKSYRVRGNCLKEYRGNTIVCRVVDPTFVLPLEESGYSATQLGHLGRMAVAPGGMILVSGETNSGKSTSLRGMLARLPETQKIVAVEDPVEVVIDHVNHVQMDRHHGDAAERFQKLKAALVRQNPDTLMMGEVRDGPSVEAIQDMALQGKRVYTTLHTQSCAAAIPRLAMLGVDPSLLGLGTFLAGVVNQNLVPVVCRECGLDRHPDAETDRRYRGLFGSSIRFRNETGCPACRGGIAGQTLVAEVWPLCLDRTGKAQELIAAGKLAALERYMRSTGVDGDSCEAKHRQAAGKVMAGQIDPSLTERIIGEFVRDDVEGIGEVVGLQRAVS